MTKITLLLLTLAGFLQAAGLDPSALAVLKPTLLVEVPGSPQMEPWSEGPVWRDGEVFSSNRPFVRVTSEGRALAYLDLHVAGTYLRGNGHILLCEHFNKALLDVSPEGEVRVVADQWDGEPLPGLNDVTADAAGNLYFTSPQGSSRDKRIGRVFRVTPEGRVDRLAHELAFPNGLEVDPASRHLFVIESQTRLILRYALPRAEHSSLGEPDEFFDLGPDSSGGDGCAFDEHGNLWVAEFKRKDANGRIIVLSSEGNLLGEVAVPARLVTNLWFGGNDRNELFIATGGPSGIFHAKSPVKGAVVHPVPRVSTVSALDLKPLNKPIQQP